MGAEGAPGPGGSIDSNGSAAETSSPWSQPLAASTTRGAVYVAWTNEARASPSRRVSADGVATRGDPRPPVNATECAASMIRCAGFSARLAISFLSSAATSATSWSASFWFITASVRSSTASGRLVRRQSTVYAICSRDADANKFAPITSASRVTRNAVRLAVDLHAMRSRRCEAPETYGFSHLEPELTYMPTAMDAPCGLMEGWNDRSAFVSAIIFILVFWELARFVSRAGGGR